VNRFVGLISKPSKRLKERSPHRFDSVPDNVHPDGESCRDQVFPRGPVLGMFWELRALGETMPTRLRHTPRFWWIAGGIALVMGVLVPMLVAMHIRQVGPLDWLLAILAYLTLWSVTAELFYMSAARLYGWRRGYLWFSKDEPLPPPLPPLLTVRTRLEPLAYCFLSYALTLYCFAVAYFFLSQTDPGAFNKPLNVFSAIYFSVVTAATVAYGDLYPVTDAARSCVLLQIFISLAYVIALFSLLSTTLKEPRQSDSV
jgi:hypothetical protein